MAIKIWNGSSWEMASQLKTWDGSAWQEGSNANVHIWTGSAWQKIHPGVDLDSTYSVSATDYTVPTGQAQAELTLFANGKIQTFIADTISGTTRTSSADWLLTATNAEYDIYVQNFSGDALTSSSPTDGTRGALSTSQTYRIQSDYPDGIKSAQFDLIICSNTGGGTIIQTASVTLSAATGI
jgi:hypothetical protein